MCKPADEPVELPVQQGYDLWSSIYDEENNPLVILEAEHVGKLLADVRGLRVLDVGCGTGRHCLALAQAGATVTGIDFSAGMLEKARAKPTAHQVRLLHHDVETTFPFPSLHFDRVVCGLVADHIEDLDRLFGEMGRICKRDGTIVVSVLHPAMMLRESQARFTDPATGLVTRPRSQRHEISDYLMAGCRSNLSIAHMSEHRVDEALVRKSERARKYLHWPMLLLLALQPCSA